MNTPTASSTKSVTLAAPAPTAPVAKANNYSISDVLTGERVGTSPALNKKRAVRIGVSEDAIKHFYISGNGQTILRTMIAKEPEADLNVLINKIRKAHNPNATDLAITDEFRKVLDFAINGGGDKPATAAKDKSMQLAAKQAALKQLGLDGTLSIHTSNGGTRTTIGPVDSKGPGEGEGTAEVPAQAPTAPESAASAPNLEEKADAKGPSKSGRNK